MKDLLAVITLITIALPAWAQQTSATPESHLPIAAPGTYATTPQQAKPSSSALAQSGKYATIPNALGNTSGRLVTEAAQEQELLPDKIYFFAHSMCVACKDAFIYLDNNHRNLNIPIIDMKFHHNLELYKQCVKKFNISNGELRLPLICMGDHYIMGWKHEDGIRFKEFLKDFQKKTKDNHNATLSDTLDKNTDTSVPKLKEPIVSSIEPSVATENATVATTNDIERTLKKLKGSEPIEPTTVKFDDNIAE